MNERIERIFDDFKKAVDNLEYAVNNTVDDLDVDGVIKRFELCYELSWKVIRLYLENLGIICKNPRDCFKHAKLNELIEDDIIWMEMIDMRNRLVHEYSLDYSKKMFNDIKLKFTEQFKKLKDKIGKGV